MVCVSEYGVCVVYVCKFVCMCGYVRVHAYWWACVCAFACVYMRVRVRVCACDLSKMSEQTTHDMSINTPIRFFFM